MKLTFLGTGTSQGIPVINSDHPVCHSTDNRDKRLRVSILVEWDDVAFVVDCGPDFRYQMLRANVHSINGILFTHEHADHVAGIDDIRPFCFQIGAVPVFGLPRVLETLALRFDYIFSNENKYPGAPSVAQNPIGYKSFELHGVTITPIKVIHGDLEILGYRFDQLAYLTDVKIIPETEIEKLQGLEILVISALRKEPHYTHITLDEALSLIEKIQPKRAYLTHISHKMGFHADVEKELPENVFLAYDELEVKV
ncbi:MBL fold metallo-hydrolase [Urechidicola sp. KH5]